MKREDEVLVRVEATAVNRADILQRQGKYPPLPGVTEVIGLECAGEIVDWDSLKPTGEKVMALLPGGGYAQYASVRRDHCVPQLKSGLIDSAGFPEVWCTAFQLVKWIAQVERSLGNQKRALVHACASGVGTSLVQLLAHEGVEVIGSCSGDKADQVKA